MNSKIIEFSKPIKENTEYITGVFYCVFDYSCIEKPDATEPTKLVLLCLGNSEISWCCSLPKPGCRIKDSKSGYPANQSLFLNFANASEYVLFSNLGHGSSLCRINDDGISRWSVKVCDFFNKNYMEYK